MVASASIRGCLATAGSQKRRNFGVPKTAPAGTEGEAHMHWKNEVDQRGTGKSRNQTVIGAETKADQNPCAKLSRVMTRSSKDSDGVRDTKMFGNANNQESHT